MVNVSSIGKILSSCRSLTSFSITQSKNKWSVEDGLAGMLSLPWDCSRVRYLEIFEFKPSRSSNRDNKGDKDTDDDKFIAKIEQHGWTFKSGLSKGWSIVDLGPLRDLE